MTKVNNFIIATKCAPDKKILSEVKKAGFEAVELFLSETIMNNLEKVIKLCNSFSFRYIVHAPSDYYNPQQLAELVASIQAEIVAFHNIYWESEWEDIVNAFERIKAKICIENISSVQEPLKFMRRYGWSRCLDLEHLQMECGGVYKEEFVRVIKQASHIHLTGYKYGSELWHTHIHYSPEHSIYLLNLLRDAGYSGFIVSEAKLPLQTYEEFKKLNDFYKAWENKEQF